MKRRTFLRATAPLIAYIPLAGSIQSQADIRFMTVLGERPVADMGLTLTHEHLFSIFGLDPEEKTEYDVPALQSVVLPFLEQAKAAGCKTIVDCTAAYFGRNTSVLKILAEKSGLNILTNTGIYGAANGRYIPAFAYSETAAQLSNRWINEWKIGIDGTGIRPGFMKLGFNPGPLGEVDKKLIHAAAITHLASGLTIAAHTSNNPAGAFEQLDILMSQKVSPSAWIWTHAHDVPDNEPLFKAARLGAWISFDGYRPEKHDRFVEGVQSLKKAGFLNRILLSHDGNGFPQKGKMPSRLKLDVLTQLIPVLLKSGFAQSDIQQITVKNPSLAFGVKVRKQRA